MICDRCKGISKTQRMSWFNEDMLCPKCEEEEKKDPRYGEAKRVELEEVRKGNLNFKGIGWDK